MNDLISRKALLAEYDRVHIGAPGGARKLMEETPAVDAVPVVRCKDCQEGYPELAPNGAVWCAIWNHIFGYDEFCSKAEKKEA